MLVLEATYKYNYFQDWIFLLTKFTQVTALLLFRVGVCVCVCAVLFCLHLIHGLSGSSFFASNFILKAFLTDENIYLLLILNWDHVNQVQHYGLFLRVLKYKKYV